MCREKSMNNIADVQSLCDSVNNYAAIKNIILFLPVRHRMGFGLSSTQ